MSKDQWIDEFDRIYSQFCDMGVSPDKAYKLATNECDAAYRERLADQADHAHLLRKEGKL